METGSRPIRRVYKPEVRHLTGWSDTWLRRQINTGYWPPGLHDPGSRRVFWLSDTVDGALARLNAAASTETVPSPLPKVRHMQHTRRAGRTVPVAA
jgi:hypothetical protein